MGSGGPESESSEAAFTSSMQAWRPDKSGVNMAVLDVAGLIVELPAAFAAAFLAVFFAGILLEWLVPGWCLDVVFLADEFQKCRFEGHVIHDASLAKKFRRAQGNNSIFFDFFLYWLFLTICGTGSSNGTAR